jgi:hypothetical protein
MTEEDMFFTHTIVGSALSLPLGNVPIHATPAQTGLQVNMQHAGTSIDQVWKDWVLIQGAYPYVGRPRLAPGALRRGLERYALLIAVVGLLLVAGAIVLAVGTVGLPTFYQ